MVQAGYDYSAVWEAKPVEKTKVIRKTYRSVDQKKVLLIKSSLLIFVYATLLVYLCIRGAVLGYQIVSIENEISNLEAANSKIEYRIAEKQSLDRVEQIAIQELCMYKADSHMVIAQEELIANYPVDSSQNIVAAVDSDQKPLEKLYAGLVILASRYN